MLGGTAVDFDPPQSAASAFGKTNVVAEQTTVVAGDLRALSREQLDKAKQTMSEIVAATLPHTIRHDHVRRGYPPMAPTDGNAKLLGDVRSGEPGSRFRARLRAVSPDKAGAADVSFVAGEVQDDHRRRRA